MLKSVDAAKGELLPLDARQMEQQINHQVNVPQSASRLPPSPDRVTMFKKTTKEMTMYESRDTQSKAKFLHRAYLAN